MGRQIVMGLAGAVAGFLAMVVFILVSFAVVAPALGLERLFAVGTWDPSTIWLAISIGLSVAGALLGGVVARLVGRDRAVHILAVLVLVTGLWSAVAGMNDTERGGPRDAASTMQDAPNKARQPLWIAVLNPLIGAAGVLVGGRRKQSS